MFEIKEKEKCGRRVSGEVKMGTGYLNEITSNNATPSALAKCD